MKAHSAVANESTSGVFDHDAARLGGGGVDMIVTDAESGDDLHVRRQRIDAGGVEFIPRSTQDASGAGLPGAAGDLGPEPCPRLILRVQAGIVIAGGARLDRLGELAGDE
jgi:hypothetical protein